MRWAALFFIKCRGIPDAIKRIEIGNAIGVDKVPFRDVVGILIGQVF